MPLHVFATGVAAGNQPHSARHRPGCAGSSRVQTHPKVSHKRMPYGNFRKVPAKPVRSSPQTTQPRSEGSHDRGSWT